MFDLGPASDELTRLVSGTREEQRAGPTPCAAWTVADLLAHLHQFATVFTDNARKQPTRPPDVLVDDRRSAIPVQLDGLARAWGDAGAWHGRVSAGGVEMDAEDNAVVAAEELVVHGWDLARATGQSLHVDESGLDRVDLFLEIFAGPIDAGTGPYGPAVAPPGGASRLELTLARTGRDPRWDLSR